MESGARPGHHVTAHGARLLRFAELPIIDRGNGIVTRQLVNPTIGSEHLTIGITTFEPGSGIALHTHNCDESVCVIEGDASCELDGERHPMRPWDTTFVPAGLPHCFVNQGQGPMSIYYTYAAGTVTRTFVETGQTVQLQSAQDQASLKRD